MILQLRHMPAKAPLPTYDAKLATNGHNAEILLVPRLH